MKKLKNLLLLLLVSFIISCSNSEEQDPTTPIVIDVSGNVDVTALDNLLGNDATALVTFGGVSAATFTSEVIPGDKLEYKITNSSTTTEIRIINFRFNPTGSTANFDDWDLNFIAVADTINVPAKAYIDVNSSASGEDTYKFDIDFKVYKNGVSDGKIFFADPKIKIKRRR